MTDAGERSTQKVSNDFSQQLLIISPVYSWDCFDVICLILVKESLSGCPLPQTPSSTTSNFLMKMMHFITFYDYPEDLFLQRNFKTMYLVFNVCQIFLYT